MALDTALRRLSAVNVGLPFLRTLPFPDGTIAVEDRYAVGGVYAGIIAQAPTRIAQLPNISEQADSGTHDFDLAQYFSGATSYSIDPAVEAGWTFNTSSGLLTIDTDAQDTFGPYTVTATNASGSVDGNTFTVKVSVSTVRMSLSGPRARLRI